MFRNRNVNIDCFQYLLPGLVWQEGGVVGGDNPHLDIPWEDYLSRAHPFYSSTETCNYISVTEIWCHSKIKSIATPSLTRARAEGQRWGSGRSR